MSVPQPAVGRMVPLAGHPLVVAVEPDQPDLVVLTAAAWAAAAGVSLCCAFVDPGRYVVAELADGSVVHRPVDPDGPDDRWLATRDLIAEHLSRVLDPLAVPWDLFYLAGRADRALTHLARAVDAAGYVVGTRAPGPGARVRQVLEGSVAAGLSHHQHRPVVVVPLEVVDWKTAHWH